MPVYWDYGSRGNMPTGECDCLMRVGLPKNKVSLVRRGSKVVCVDDSFPKEIVSFYTHLPVKDRVYTIRDMGVGINLNGEMGEVVVYLVGMPNPSSLKPPYPERGFNQERFREIMPPPWEEVENEAPVEETIT